MATERYQHQQHSLSNVSEPVDTTLTTKFKIALCQLAVKAEKKVNIEKARGLIEFAADQTASLVVLPEMWNCPYSNDYFAKNAEDFNDEKLSPTFWMLSESAFRHKITIVGGSVPEWSNGHLYNTCCVFGPDGKLKAKHRKLHLFDIDVPGEISFKESDTFCWGKEPTIVDTDVGRIGIGICHDLRFPELAMLYREKGVQIICYPGAFNMSTGEMLWELEQRARAVDNQLFVATCSPARDSFGSYTIWGNSTVVGPSGEVIATTGHEETVLFAEIDYSNILLQRKQIPMNQQKWNDIYKFINVYEQKGLQGLTREEERVFK